MLHTTYDTESSATRQRKLRRLTDWGSDCADGRRVVGRTRRGISPRHFPQAPRFGGPKTQSRRGPPFNHDSENGHFVPVLRRYFALPDCGRCTSLENELRAFLALA